MQGIGLRANRSWAQTESRLIGARTHAPSEHTRPRTTQVTLSEQPSSAPATAVPTIQFNNKGADREGRVGREVADQSGSQRRQRWIAPLVCSATHTSRQRGVRAISSVRGQDSAAPVKQSKKTMWNDRSLRDSLRNQDSNREIGQHQKEAWQSGVHARARSSRAYKHRTQRPRSATSSNVPLCDT